MRRRLIGIVRTRSLRRGALRTGALAALLLASPGCELLDPTEPGDVATCGGFGDWETSPYVLPYPVGRSYFVSQGACDQGGTPTREHRAEVRYGNDFDMPVGTTVTAARAGVVSDVSQDAAFVVIDHGDGTWGGYFHLEAGGSLVQVGEAVAQGQPVGLSGDALAGTSARHGHLHFQVQLCSAETVCDTVPVNYRNTDPNPLGVRSGRHWEAYPYG